MGIRFLCPNGHKLNVKTDLAGRRAMCPTCGAKLIVPTESGGMAESTGTSSTELPLAAPSGIDLQARPGAPPVVVPPEKPPQGGAWFVRPKSGGQFGPATDDVLSDWIREGRITADAHVWRDGWPQWKLAREVADALPAPLPPVTVPPVVATPPPKVAESTAAASPVEAIGPEIQNEATVPASRYRASRLRKNRLQLTLAVVMLAAIGVLAVVLWWVLLRGTETSEKLRPTASVRPTGSSTAMHDAGRFREAIPLNMSAS